MNDYEEISKVAEIMASLYIEEIEDITPCLKERIGRIETIAKTHGLIVKSLKIKLIDALYAYHGLAAMQAEGES